ncbi:MAG: hypothetical protein LBQ24_02845 [Candidatus Peribacteria bacterium]|nr:hypothetical protein [Candidatus Peribacteria bacterium]
MFAFSSSQDESKYITQLNIRANTAITATICINSDITFAINFSHDFPSIKLSSGQPGNHSQVILVEWTKSVTKSKEVKIIIYIFFSIINYYEIINSIIDTK